MFYLDPIWVHFEGQGHGAKVRVTGDSKVVCATSAFKRETIFESGYVISDRRRVLAPMF